jgi:hypothetical protein
MQVVKNDYLAGFERDGRYKLLQMHYARMLEKELTKEEILARYLNTVFFGNNAYGIAGGRRDLLRQDRPGAHVHRVGVPRRVRALAVGLRPDQRTRAQPGPVDPGARTPRRTRKVTEAEADRGRSRSSSCRRGSRRCPSERSSAPTSPRRCATTCSTAADMLGDTYQERYNQLFRGGCASTPRSMPTCSRRASRPATSCPTPSQLLGIRRAIVSLDSTTGAIRAMVGGRGFVPASARSTWRCRPARPGRASRCSSSPPRCRRAPSRTTSRRHRPCVLPNPGNEDEPFEISDAVDRGVVTLQEHTTASINCAFARLSQIVGLNRVVDTIYRMSSRRTCTGISPGPSGCRSSRSPASRPAPTRCRRSTWRRASRRSPTRACTTSPYYVEFIDNADGERIYTHLDPGTRCSTATRHWRPSRSSRVPIYGGGTGRRAAFDDGARRSARPAPSRTTPTPGSSAGPSSCRRRSGSATQRLHADAGHPRVRRRGLRAQRPGRSLPGRDLEGVHGAGPHLRPVRSTGSSPPPERPNARLYLPGNECDAVRLGRRSQSAARVRTGAVDPTTTTPTHHPLRRSRRPRRRRATGTDDRPAAGRSVPRSSRSRSAPRSRPTTSIRWRRCRRCRSRRCSGLVPQVPHWAAMTDSDGGLQRPTHQRRSQRSAGAAGRRHRADQLAHRRELAAASRFAAPRRGAAWEQRRTILHADRRARRVDRAGRATRRRAAWRIVNDSNSS